MALDYFIVGSRIRAIRKKHEITQEELAKRLDLSVAFLSRVERGKSHISLKRLAELSQMLDVSISYLLEGSVENTNEYLIDDFNKVLKKCNPERQRKILEMAKIISKIK